MIIAQRSVKDRKVHLCLHLRLSRFSPLQDYLKHTRYEEECYPFHRAGLLLQEIAK